MEQVGEETSRLMEEFPEDEFDSAFDRVVTPPPQQARGLGPTASAKASERLHTLISHSLVTDVRRLTDDELAWVQAMAGADEWFIEGDDIPVGPLTTAQMRERWLAHALKPESRCWGVGLPGWTPLCRISALSRALGPQPKRPVRPSASAPTPTPRPPAPSARPVEPPPSPREVLPEIAAPPPEPPAPAPAPTAPAVPAYVHHFKPPPVVYEELDVDEPEVSPAHRWVRVALGVLVVAGGLVFLAVPFLSPPAPEMPPPPFELPAVASPRTGPAARQQAPDRPAPAQVAKKASTSASPSAPAKAAAAPVASKAIPDEAEVEEEVAEDAPVKEERPADPSSQAAAYRAFPDTPEVDDAFDRAFGKPPAEPKAAAAPGRAERSVYVPPAPSRADKPKARLTESDIMQVVVAHKAQVMKCRAAALAVDPDLSGKLVMRWTVNTDGEAEDVQALPDGDLADTDLAACVEQAIWDWKFPRHTEEQSPITFPFVF